MKPKERLDQLIKEGCVLQILPEAGTVAIEFTLAGALWLGKPARLRWCAIFPEHQGHVHETRYDTATLGNGGRDVLFYRDGRLVLCAVPYLEAVLNTDEVREAFTEWQAHLNRPGNEAHFTEFFVAA